jgi:cupin 2 domain-containing protein
VRGPAVNQAGERAGPDNGKPDKARGTLFAGAPADLPQEIFETLARSDAVHIERIVSKGHASPPEGWYDQQRNEWVLLLQGAARIAFADGDEVTMQPGDWLSIPARCKHRVAWTDPEQESIWLAVHYL